MTRQRQWHDRLALLAWAFLPCQALMLLLGYPRGGAACIIIGVMCSITAVIVRNPEWTPNELFWLVVRGVTLGIGVATLLWR